MSDISQINESTFDAYFSRIATEGLSRRLVQSMLSASAPEYDDDFGDQIRRLAFQAQNDPGYSHRLDAILREIVDDSTVETTTAYKAFKAVVHLHRRHQNLSIVRKLLSEKERRFDKFPSFQFLKFAYTTFRSSSDFLLAILFAREELRNNPSNAGVHNAFADLMARALEEGFELRQLDELTRQAKEAVGRAIVLRPYYAKYRATLGRLLAIEKDLEGAKTAIREAIDLEDARSNDYALRLQEYAAHLQRIEQSASNAAMKAEFAKAQAELDTAIEKNRSELDRARTLNIEILGFFTAIISFILTTVQLVRSEHIQHPENLLITLIGCLLFAFGGLTFVLHGPRNWLRSVPLLVLGMVALVLGKVGFDWFGGFFGLAN